MGQIRLLDKQLLDDFERALGRQSAVVLARTPPGLSQTEIESVFAGAGLTATREALVWWSWRDGSTLDVLPGLGHIPLRRAFEGYDILRQLAKQAGEEATGELRDPDAWWKPGWVPMFDTRGEPKIVLDCSGLPDAPAPLRQVEWSSIGDSGFAEAFAPSLGDYVGKAVDALASGRYRFDAEQNIWVPTSWADLPPGKRFD